MSLDNVEMVLYDYVEGQSSLDAETMQFTSQALHELIESVIQDVCYDNNIEGYLPEY